MMDHDSSFEHSRRHRICLKLGSWLAALRVMPVMYLAREGPPFFEFIGGRLNLSGPFS